MLGVVASVLAVVCKRVQQLLTMLGPALHLGTDTTHKTLQTMRNTRAWPEQCWKSCANGSNVVALRFCDHGTKEMLGVAGSKVWLVSNFAQQLPTTCNRVCKRPWHVTSKEVVGQQCCVRLHETWLFIWLLLLFLTFSLPSPSWFSAWATTYTSKVLDIFWVTWL